MKNIEPRRERKLAESYPAFAKLDTESPCSSITVINASVSRNSNMPSSRGSVSMASSETSDSSVIMIMCALKGIFTLNRAVRTIIYRAFIIPHKCCRRYALNKAMIAFAPKNAISVLLANS